MFIREVEYPTGIRKGEKCDEHIEFIPYLNAVAIVTTYGFPSNPKDEYEDYRKDTIYVRCKGYDGAVRMTKDLMYAYLTARKQNNYVNVKESLLKAIGIKEYTFEGRVQKV